ncbi:EGF domain-specific O-linked N-acetylglucosamine transferase-like [Mytilus galloprovincialis]|uniref:EGF domain-specific O-linked N-acetylglucosamine transferase-like n=1 Tax=Mytilus galloprovincialis TaxID=29158 RepID=UPI003F7C4AC2
MMKSHDVDLKNCIYLFILTVDTVICFSWNTLNLPKEHIPYFFNNNPDIKEECKRDEKCPFQDSLSIQKCWGYEEKCPSDQRMIAPSCPGGSRGWAKDKATQVHEFWKAADFGYMKERRNELKVICQPESEEDSLLECCRYTRYCRARNIFLDFTNAHLKQGNERFREDVFKDGEIGGKCTLNQALLRDQSEHKSPLQSWYAELEHYTSLPFHPENKCDIIIDKPSILIKLDAGVNLYHHFCDFVNIYAAQHVNNSFSTDVYIVMWDTSDLIYRDFFDVTWKAFTDYPVLRLSQYDGKKVCFKDAVFSLLPRMRYGLYYNMPLIPGCHSSSFFRAFNQHLMHRLNVQQEGPLEEKIRVTLLSRSTKYRKILNEIQLVNAMKTVGEFDVRKVDFNLDLSFLDQIKVSHNSDIFIGIHGAGLTHALFQPDWGVVMEIYNCEDDGCYSDLARLRGVKYMTWEKKDKLIQEDEGHHPTLGAHAKFTNYEFDVSEFMRLVSKAADHVRNHPSFIQARKEKYSNVKDEL